MSDEAKDFFFIDANRAYRGPVTKQTLHFLLQTSAISPQTYVFAEHLKEANNNSWVRLKRLPELLEELSKPLDTSAGPSAAGPSVSGTLQITFFIEMTALYSRGCTGRVETVGPSWRL